MTDGEEPNVILTRVTGCYWYGLMRWENWWRNGLRGNVLSFYFICIKSKRPRRPIWGDVKQAVKFIDLDSGERSRT